MIKRLFRQMSGTQILSAPSPLLAKLFLGSDPEILAISIPALHLYSFSLLPCAIITYGFTKDKTPHHIDVRLVLEENKHLMRIRSEPGQRPAGTLTTPL